VLIDGKPVAAEMVGGGIQAPVRDDAVVTLLY
jgi:hypothetical protein